MPQIANFLISQRRACGALARLLVEPGGDNNPVNLARIGWLATVLICLVVVVILVLQGYLGYAGVTFAVAVAAAINLF